MAQIDEASVIKHECNKQLYNALMKGDEEKVIHLCQKVLEEGPLHILTIHDDTVLHMATYSKQKDLVLNLLKLLPSQDNFPKLLTLKNDTGNTVLHEAATSDRIVPAAREMLRICPDLLEMSNFRGETALFRAARYGKIRMFEFLNHHVDKFVASNDGDYRKFHRRNDGTTILHISILSEHFDLALMIVDKYKYLVGETDGDGMTGLQLLACNSSAFLSGRKRTSLKKLFYSFTSKQSLNLAVSGVSTEDSTAQGEVQACCRVPLWEAIQSKKRKYNSALQLAKVLIERDTSWENTESAMDESKPKTHKYGAPSTSSLEHAPTTTGSEIIPKKNAGTPLILATKSGCTEIVEEILQKYPQAVEHVDDEGRNILHVAIKYRRLDIFDIVEKMEVPMMRLIRKIDNNGNSILHMVGLNAQHDDEEDMRSPALRLQEVLLLFERVQNISTAHFIKHFNSEGKTAEKLLEKTTAPLRSDAKEWLKRTAENCSIVAVLIATVAFAAAYTIPGGPNQNTGYPILLNEPFFVIFTMADVLSLAFALTSVITFLSVLTSPFRLRDFKQSLPQKLMLGVTLLIVSVSMMMFAFAATVILMIRNKQQWTKIALSSVAFLPVTIFALSYLPLYTSLMETFMYSLKKIEPAFPRCNRDHRYHSWLANFKRFQATNAPNDTRSQAIMIQKTCHPV